MGKQRRSFTAEFKREAAALVLDQGYSHAEACRSLDVGETAMRRWVDQLRKERAGVTGKTLRVTRGMGAGVQDHSHRLQL